MDAPLHIISSCADRKRSGHGPDVRLRAFTERDPDVRLARWWRALSNGGPRLPAAELYVGPYWATVRDLPGTRANQKFAITAWVASAGYGLVSALAPLRPYSATFRVNAPDSVVRPADLRRGFDSKCWWNALTRLRAPGASAPRSLTSLAKETPRARLLIIGSSAYLAAMEDDLIGALAHLQKPDRMVIVCGAPGPSQALLKQCWIPSGARLLSRVGGSLPALHARVAKRILDESPRYGLDAPRLRARWVAIAKRSPEAMKVQRDVSTDQQVKDFIRAALQKTPALKHTRLLRDFRASGRACEQSRFRNLFRQVIQEQSR